MQTIGVKTVKKEGYIFELSTNKTGQPLCLVKKILTSGKNKGSYKILANYRFRTDEARKVYISNYLKEIQKDIDTKEANKKAIIEAKDKNEIPYKVGDIFYCSWGYEQTNVDYYQIINIKGSNIKFHKISQYIVKDTQGHDYANVAPNKDSFIDEPFIKRLVINAYNGKPSYHIRMNSYSSLYLYENGEKGKYSSWGY